MKKYNYFDDEPLSAPSEKSSLHKINLDNVKQRVKRGISWLSSGEIIDDIKSLSDMPNLRKAVIKTAIAVFFVIFVILFIIIFTATINSQNKKIELFHADAGKVCTDTMLEYGVIKTLPLDEKTYGEDMVMLTGLCYVRQIDFDNDNSPELFLVHNSKNTYTLEVWSYVKKEFTKIYSHEINSTENTTDGSWIGLYHHKNKYYLCLSEKSNPQKVTFYALKGHSFKEDSGCDYDYKNNIYSIDGKINAQDFETIKFSVIKSSKAESITDTVSANIDELSTVSVAELDEKKTPEDLKNDAYYEIVEKRNNEYGKAQINRDDSNEYIDGLAVVRLVDFNKDGNDELFIAYRKIIKISTTNNYYGQSFVTEEPTYCMEVYDWNGTIARKVFSKDSVSNFLGDSDSFYVMLRNSAKSVDICTNSYDYQSERNYTASSRIYRMSEKETFDSIFNARIVSEYGWNQYYIDNEYTYRSQFEEEGYQVPMFMDDDASYDDSKYTVLYLSSDEKSKELESVVDDTVKTIETLNKNYVAD